MFKVGQGVRVHMQIVRVPGDNPWAPQASQSLVAFSADGHLSNHAVIILYVHCLLDYLFYY